MKDTRTIAITMIPVAGIDAGSRLRALDPSWVELLADEMGSDGQHEPIRVVQRGDRHLLVAGARRVAAATALGWKEIAATVIPADELADEASVRLAEIKADMMRGDLTVLDRARYTAAWRDIYVSTHEISKGGRKRRDASAEELEELSAKFALSFSEAAQKALQISRRSLFDALKIASIDAQAAERIALHPSANKRGELILLAEQSPAMQAAIVDMICAVPATAISVVDALATLGAMPSIQPEPAYSRLSEKFARLPEKDQFAFFSLHESAIDLWLAKRASGARKAA